MLKIEMFSVLGQRILFQSLLQNAGDSQTSLDVSTQPAGLYLLKITDENGFSITRKIIKL